MLSRLFLILILSAIFTNNYSQEYSNYEITHGEEITDHIAPYLKDFCLEENLNCDSLIGILFDDTLLNESSNLFMPISLSSEKHINGNWTYFKAKTPLIYEIEKIDSTKYLILYNKQHTQTILENKKSKWSIALINKNLKIIDNSTFITQLKYNNEYYAMWDMIYTNLDTKPEEIIVKITYVHTGGGGSRDQEFTAKIKVDDKISNIDVRQTLDDNKY